MRRQREVRLRQAFSKRETSASKGAPSGRNKAGLRPGIRWVSWPPGCAPIYLSLTASGERQGTELVHRALVPGLGEWPRLIGGLTSG